MAKTYLFVFGTLKRGYGNNARCLDGAKFLGEAISVEANYVMQRIGFPILWQDNTTKKAAKVSGEIFDVSPEHIAVCDRLEGHPRMYKREQREFHIGHYAGKRIITAWVYLWQQNHTGDPMKPVNGAYEWSA